MGRSVGFVAVVALVSCGGDAEREATGEVTASGAVDAFDVQGGRQQPRPTTVQRPKCRRAGGPMRAGAHRRGLPLVRSRGRRGIPGEDKVISLADEGCLQQFEAFVGLPPEQSRLKISTLFPTDETWEQFDDRGSGASSST